MRVKLDRSLLLALLVSVSLVGCKKSSPGSSSPGADASVAGEAGDPLAQLHALEGRMQALGLPVGSQQPPAGAGGGAAAGGDADVGEAVGGEAEALGPAAPTMAPAPSEAKQDAPTRRERDVQADGCTDLCSLSESICTLEVHICELAAAHDEDPVYADACERAVDDCDVAGRACEGCER